MKILIQEIPDDGLDIELSETITTPAFLAPVHAQLRIEKVGTEVVVVKGNLGADIELQCSRCLKDYKSMLSIPVDVVYHPVDELRGEDKHELKGGEMDMGFYSAGELDMIDLMREQIMLNIPMKPLCNEMCKGICLKCGTDLNTSECSCTAHEIGPGLEALKKLLDK